MKGCSWTRDRYGCLVRIYGLCTVADRALAERSAQEIRDAVLIAVPAAYVEMISTSTEVCICVSVSADDLAIFHGGPMHRAACQRARMAASYALDSCSWSKEMRK